MDFIDALEAVSRLRTGTVLTPEELRRETTGLKGEHQVDGYGLEISVPDWLVTALERPSSPPRIQLQVASRGAHTDYLLLLTLQAQRAQLRIVMQLSYEPVQHLLFDSIHQNRLRLLLASEHTGQCALLTMSSLQQEAARLMGLIRDARTASDSAEQLASVCARLLPMPALPSLIEGEVVSGCITVCVGDPVQLDRYARTRPHAPIPMPDDETGTPAPGERVH